MSDPADDLFLKAVFEIAFFPDADGAAVPWYRDRKIVQGIVDAVARTALFQEFKLAGPEDKQAPFQGVEAAKQRIAVGRDDVVYLQDGPDDERQAMVRIAPFDGSMTLKIWCGGAALRRHHATLFDQLTSILTEVRAQLAGIAGLQYGFVYPVHDLMVGFEYPRPRPPQRHPSIQTYAVVDYLDLRFHRSAHPDAALDGVDALLGGALPDFVERTEADDLVVLRWAHDPSDEAQLMRGASAHEVWIAAHLPTRIDGPYNSLGDGGEELAGDEVPHKPLTLYSPSSQIGYKAVVVFPDGTIEAGAWRDATAVLAAGQLPSGEAVDQLKLIAPKRDLALQISKQAKETGFAAVLFPSDDGQFWDPDPPGLWIGPPIVATDPAE